METTFRRGRLCSVCRGMHSGGKASWPRFLQPVYSNSAANTADPWGSVFWNMVTKGYLWTPQNIVIHRLADISSARLAWASAQAQVRGECVLGVGSEDSRAGTGDICVF